MKLKLMILSCLLALFVFGNAQDQSDLEFNELTHEFGTVDKGDPTEFTFTFKNTTEAPVTLSRVKASCGCTTPDWTRDAIAPGASGEIKVKYNSNRIGPFTKSITVTYDDTKKPVVLYIKGEVKGTVEPPKPRINYSQTKGGLAFDKVNAYAGTVDSDKSQSMTFNVKNISPIKIDFTDKIESSEKFDISISQTELTPGQTAIVTVKVNGEKFEKGGTFNETISLFTNEEIDGQKDFVISGRINKLMTAEEKAALPHIKFANTRYEAGKVLEGEVVKAVFKFTNTGKQDLMIESVKASCGCTVPELKSKVIKAGETSEIVANFNSKGRPGNQSKSITVKTNDPDQPSIVLRLSAEVEKDPFHFGGDGPSARPDGDLDK